MRVTLLAVLLIALSACASAPPTPVAGIDPLVGKWRGTVTVGRALVFIHLTIERDRTLVATWGDITTRGTVASYQMAPPPQEGTFKLYTDKGKRQLYMESISGEQASEFYAVVEPDA